MVSIPTGQLIGADIAKVDVKPEFALGTVVELEKGGAAIYAKAGAEFAGEGYVGYIDEDFLVVMADTGNTNTAFGFRAAVAQALVPQDSYAWFVFKGETNVRVSASCAANVYLNSTATPGQLDDDHTAGAERVDGIILTEARAASAGLAPGYLTNAVIGATI